jgi:hypothetical protein
VHWATDDAKLEAVPPLVLALIDSVFALALHHQQRANRGLMPDYESALVRAEVCGPVDEPVDGGIVVRVSVTLVPRSEEREVTEEHVSICVDLDDPRLLARDLDLAELPLDRSGLARVIGELEGWCYARIPLQQLDDDDDDDET